MGGHDSFVIMHNINVEEEHECMMIASIIKGGF
jgi:hypothetical protein